MQENQQYETQNSNSCFIAILRRYITLWANKSVLERSSRLFSDKRVIDVKGKEEEMKPNARALTPIQTIKH